jgi:hypothetical protein
MGPVSTRSCHIEPLAARPVRMGTPLETYFGIAKMKMKLNQVLLFHMGNPMNASLYPLHGTHQ